MCMLFKYFLNIDLFIIIEVLFNKFVIFMLEVLDELNVLELFIVI